MATSKTNRKTAMPRHYFGSYLNMALHNAYMIMEELTKKYGLGGQVQDENLNIATIINNNSLPPDKLQYIAKDLLHHFPFLNYDEENKNYGAVIFRVQYKK